MVFRQSKEPSSYVVAVDGPAGSGKSTIAEKIAEHFDFLCIHSGELYRGFTRTVLDAGLDPRDDDKLRRCAEQFAVEFSHGEFIVNGARLADDLSTDEVNRWVSRHSSLPVVRSVVNHVLRSTAAGQTCIIEGRDIGTIVFPHANVKIYLDATVETRALRRYAQGGSVLSLTEIQSQIATRDAADRRKQIGRLVRARDAQYLDTSDLTIDHVCAKISEIVCADRNLCPEETRTDERGRAETDQ